MRAAVIAGAAGLLACGAIFLVPAKQPAAAPNAAAPHNEMVAAARAAAHPGDVLFKKGPGFWGSLAARFSENADGYGHVGLVALGQDGALLVIHAGGDPVTRNGRVQRTTLEDFIGASTAAALYRPRLEAASALLYAEGAVERNAPFDSDFSLDTEDALYCTELIWRALSSALGEDAIPEKSKRSGKVYVAIDDLQESRWLEEVWRHRENAPPTGA